MDKHAVPKFKFYRHIFKTSIEIPNYFEITLSVLSYSDG